MPYSPPKKSTLMLSLLLELLGVILAFSGFLDTFAPQPVALGYNMNELCIIIGLILTLISWFIMFLGVKFRGI